MKHSAKTLQFEELKSLDLQKCETVGDIVDAMRYCAFGARMLGEVATTICEMATAQDKPLLIYDGLENSPLGRCSKNSLKIAGAGESCSPSAYAKQKARGDNVIVVGAFSERDAEAIYKKPKRGRSLSIPSTWRGPARFVTAFSLTLCSPIRASSCR